MCDTVLLYFKQSFTSTSMKTSPSPQIVFLKCTKTRKVFPLYKRQHCQTIPDHMYPRKRQMLYYAYQASSWQCHFTEKNYTAKDWTHIRMRIRIFSQFRILVVYREMIMVETQNMFEMPPKCRRHINKWPKHTKSFQVFVKTALCKQSLNKIRNSVIMQPPKNTALRQDDVSTHPPTHTNTCTFVSLLELNMCFH